MEASSVLCAASSDRQLVDAARDGDDRAFEQLYERYYPRINAFVARLAHDRDRAEDLTQDVFISALHRLRATEQAIAFRPWIYEIARNACIDEYRRSRRTREVPLERDGADGWLAHPAGGPSPDVAAERKQQLEDLCGAFRGLSERHHRIIVLRELEGMSYRQIGEQLGISKVVVESTLFRARRRLTEEYEDLTSGRRCERVRQILETGRERPPRRLGLRDRRAVSNHVQHCVSCRKEAIAAGFGFLPGSERPTQRAAAAILPIPALSVDGLLRILRRGRAAAAAAVRSVHQSAVTAASPVTGLAQSVASADCCGRIAATALVVVAAGVGGGLLSQTSPAHAGARGEPAIVRTGPGGRSDAAASATAALILRRQPRSQRQLTGRDRGGTAARRAAKPLPAGAIAAAPDAGAASPTTRSAATGQGSNPLPPLSSGSGGASGAGRIVPAGGATGAASKLLQPTLGGSGVSTAGGAAAAAGAAGAAAQAATTLTTPTGPAAP